MAKANPTFEGRKDETTKPLDAGTTEAPETPSTEPKYSVELNHVITQKDLDENPLLVKDGRKVGDVIDRWEEEIVEEKTTTVPTESEGAE